MITLTIMKYELWTIVIYCVHSLKVTRSIYRSVIYIEEDLPFWAVYIIVIYAIYDMILNKCIYR